MLREKYLPLWLKATLLIFCSIVSSATEQESTIKAPAQAMQATYVGSDACASCHEDIVKAIKKTTHGGRAFEMRSAQGCESCHGPGSAHVDSGGDPALIKSFKQMKPNEASETCFPCHQAGKQMHWKGSTHARRDISCVSCHSVHGSKSEEWLLKAARVEETCATCHLPVKAQIQKTSHHPIREGLMSCSNCHNPHGTTAPKLIEANSANEQCLSCHTEKRGPFLWEHPPVKENCMNCHNPHGSNHPKLLIAKRPYLCQTCHLDTRHPGTLYDGSPTSLASNREFLRSCSNCHLTVHGSNHPSGWTFLR